MNIFLLFALGSIVFALVVYAAVMVGGLKMTKETLEHEEPDLGRRVPDEELEGLPTDAKF